MALTGANGATNGWCSTENSSCCDTADLKENFAMRVMLVNDTGVVSHIGCLAVSDAHARMLGRAGHHVAIRYFIDELRRFKDADPVRGERRVLDDDAFMEELHSVDAVIVNAEGTIHHGAGTEYLNVLAAASRIGKVTLLVNAVLEAIEGFDEVLHRIDDVTVRDRRSARWLEGCGRTPRIVPDSFIEARFEEDPLLDLSGQVVVTDWHHQRDKDSGAASIAFMRGHPEMRPFFFPLMCGNIAPHWRKTSATLRNARALVTGRHHGVYAAVLAKVPFVALSSNTHKVAGILDEFPQLGFCLDPPSIVDALARAEQEREAFHPLGERILGARPLSTFHALGATPDAEGEARELSKLAQDVASRFNTEPGDLAYRIHRRSYETCMTVASA
jgi:hypothetical protein